jgi:tetratricopeptide (TPR) repeat protein
MTSNTQTPLAGLRVAFVGKLGGLSRREAMRVVREAGGLPSEDASEDAVDLIVLGAEESPLAEEALLGHAQRWAETQGRLEVITETELWQRLGLVEPELAARRLYTPAMLADLLHVSVRVIRRWHRRGLIVPVRTVHQLPYFDFQEVATARRLAELLASGASPQAIERKLARLASILPDVERPLAQLSVIVQGRQLLLRQGEGLIDPGGQMWIDFEGLERETGEGGAGEATSTVEFPSAEALAEPLDPLQEQAYALEDAGDLEGAIDCYHALLGRQGANANYCFQLGELLYRAGELTAARERYYAAVELNEDFVEARASLAAVLSETGRPDLAIAAYQGTLALHDDYPDVHYNLARLLDDVGQRLEAEPHWRRFLQLSPQSAWAEEAQQRLGITDHD